MTADPLVSVVIPTYYRNDWLRKAIQSAHEQTYEPIEVIVVDDSGERYAESVAREYDVIYIGHEQNQGGNPARNTGIEEAKGEYIQLLDDDDRLLPAKIENQVSVLESSSTVGVVYCGLQQENGDLVFPKEENRGDVLAQALRINQLHPCQTGTMFFDGDILRELHPLRSRKAADDIGLKIRAAARTKFDFVDEILLVKGDSEDHRGAKLGFSDEVLGIVDEFDHLYSQFGDRVRKDALAAGYQSRGVRLLNDNWWSLEAVICFAKALYYSDPRDLQLVGSFVSSLFGRPGYLMIRRAYNRLSRQRVRSK